MKESMRVLITERCNADCKNCFNKGRRHGIDMGFDGFQKLCLYLHDVAHVKRLKIMGGEPTVHSDFLRFFLYAQEVFPVVILFTNGINDAINHIAPRENDIIVYNLECMGLDFDVNKLLLNRPGKRILETQISHDCDVFLIKEKIERIIHNSTGHEIIVSLTLNCVENIFDFKKEIVDKLQSITSFLQRNLVSYTWDHGVPFCFSVNTGIKFPPKALCSYECCGLITADYHVQYCNQNPVDIGIIYDEQAGIFVPFDYFEKKFRIAYAEKMEMNKHKICSDCPLWFTKCNGGCFIHKDFITKGSILRSF